MERNGKIYLAEKWDVPGNHSDGNIIKEQARKNSHPQARPFRAEYFAAKKTSAASKI